MLAMPSAVLAQNIDTEPPQIEFKPVREGLRGDNQVFAATVTDDQGVDSVFLHHRLQGETIYQNRKMQVLGSTGIYTATITTSEMDEAIEYYLEATDLSGNRTLQGFAFDPIERQLVERQVPAATEPVAGSGSGMSTRSKILYGVLGLLVVGALASAAGGGSSGGTGTEVVPVTITVQPLP
ncbi:MAG: hypothetical protein HKN42_06640 [Granulosicoccus sp.]|nr:hypothetical protein [Granulosicoccus sp.]